MGQNTSVPSTLRPQPCSSCREWGDPKYNTVKVDFSQLRSSVAIDNTENQPPSNCDESTRTKEEEKEILAVAWERETQRRHREWEEKQRRSSRQRQLLDQEQQEHKRQQMLLQAEAMRRQIEEDERKQKEKEELQLSEQRQEEEERRQQEAQRQAEDAKRRQVELREAERDRKLQEIEASQGAQSWLQEHGFAHANDQQRKRFAKVRPLHVAVQNCDLETVQLLLKAGADRKLISSKKETPLQLALRLNKKGEQSAIVAVLSDSVADPAYSTATQAQKLKPVAI